MTPPKKAKAAPAPAPTQVVPAFVARIAPIAPGGLIGQHPVTDGQASALAELLTADAVAALLGEYSEAQILIQRVSNPDAWIAIPASETAE